MTKRLHKRVNWHIKLFGCLILLQLLFVNNMIANVHDATETDKDSGQLASAENDSIPKVESYKINPKKIFGDELKDIPSADLEDLLQGRLSGFFVKNWNGAPGIQSVMGVNTVNTLSMGIDNRPLILIDDVPIFVDPSQASEINPLSEISPEYIESIEVLSSSLSMAKYGARGANGVISIVTKNGSSYNGTHISLSVSGGVNFEPELRSTISGNSERSRLKGLYNKAIALPGDLDGIQLPMVLTDSLNPFYGYHTDWQEDQYKPRSVQNYNLKIGNSGSFGHYLLHLGYYDDKSPKEDVGLQRMNLNLNTRYNVTERLILDVMLLASRANRGNATSNLFNPSFFAENDDLSVFPPTIFEDDAELRDDNINNHLLTNINLGYDITDNLTFKTMVGLDYETGRRDYFIPSTINDGRIFSLASTSTRQRIINENTLNYRQLINDKAIEITVGQSIIMDDVQYNEITADRDGEGTSNFVKTIGSNYSLASKDGGSIIAQNSLLSFFAEASFEVAEGLELNGVLRADGTSKLPEDQRWGIYPAVEASWDLGNVFSIDNTGFLSLASLNAGIGKSGLLPTEDYLWKSDTRTIGGYDNITGVTRYARQNDTYTNPTSSNFNVGVDLGLFGNSIFVNAEYFSNDIKDFQYQVMLPNTVGYSDEIKNGIGIKNTGFNAALSSNIHFGELSWTARLTASVIANEVTAMPDDANNITFGSISEGRPINGFYMHASDGFYANDDEVPVNPVTGFRVSYAGVELGEGMPKLLDKNGDYIIDQNDKYYAGSQQPDVFGGFGNTFEYRGFYLDALFSYAFGGDIMVQSVSNRYSSDVGEFNRGMFESLEGDTEYYMLRSDDDNVSIQGISAIEKASYIRLNNLTVGYRLGDAALVKYGFQNSRIFITGKNLFVSNSGYSGLDPEENRDAVNEFNLSTTGVPRYKSISIGISIGL